MFYEELKKRRESLGITLDQISNKTKVNKTILEAFEAGDFSKLPRTYVRLFLRAYAQELNTDPEQVIKSFEEYTGKHEESLKPETLEKENSFLSPKNNSVVNGKKKRSIAAITAVLVIVIFLISVLKQVLIEEEKKNQAPLPVSIKELPIPIEDTDTTAIEQELVAMEITPETQIELLSLIMTTRDTCWVRVITDESDTTEANYLPNIRREWKARDKFDVRVGRPSKVVLYLNNKELRAVGNRGIPLRLIITKDGIVRSTLLRR